ncbi:hypothetical protein GCM10020295_17310 [Streptomyces cinereospinus]
MKHRGRHRRRRRGQALRAFLAGTALALTGAATLISTSQATVGTDPGGLEPVTAAASLADLRLTEERIPRPAPTVPDRPVGVAAVLADADRSLRAAADCTGAERSALPTAPAATRAHCWDEPGTDDWRTGAVTTSGDADDDGRWGAHRVILSGWSDRQGHSRVAFVDADDPDRLSYAWVALTVPAAAGGDPAGRPLRSDLSGMVWYQDKLLVTADEGRALYVYDLDRIRRTGAGTRASAPPPAATGTRYRPSAPTA